MEPTDEYKKRVDNFARLRHQKPPEKTILTPKNDEKIMVQVQYKEDMHRTMFVNAAIDEEATGWYLVNEDQGLKCLILPHSQEHLIRLNDGETDGLTVTELRVMRHNGTRTALICEVVGCPAPPPRVPRSDAGNETNGNLRDGYSDIH